MTTLSYILLQIDNVVNPEALTISGMLITYIWLLRDELKSVRAEIKKQVENHQIQIQDQAKHYREHIERLVAKNDKLQEEKYKVTREVIPLLIELIDKLDKEEKNE